MLNQTPKGEVLKEENKKESEAWGRAVRCQNRNPHRQESSALTPRPLRTKTWEHSSSVSQTRQGWEALWQISLVHKVCLSIVCLSIQEYQTIGNNSPAPCGEAEGACMGQPFLWSDRHPAIPQQGSLMDQGCLPVDSRHLIFCLWPWHHLGMPSPH